MEDVDLIVELNVPIIVVSVIIMFVGTVIPTILVEYIRTDLLVAISMGALVSIVGNLVLLYGQKNNLVKVFAVRFGDKVIGKAKFVVEKIEEKETVK